jgi:hypothetical protein
LEFATKRQARAFINRLNKVPEIAGYVEADHKELVILGSEFARLTNFLKETLTAEQFAALTALDIRISENF